MYLQAVHHLHFYLCFRSGTLPTGIRRLGDCGLSFKKTLQSKWTLFFPTLRKIILTQNKGPIIYYNSNWRSGGRELLMYLTLNSVSKYCSCKSKIDFLHITSWSLVVTWFSSRGCSLFEQWHVCRLCIIPNYYNSIDLAMAFIYKVCNCKKV